jgi:hypothetical protein
VIFVALRVEQPDAGLVLKRRNDLGEGLVGNVDDGAHPTRVVAAAI